jgi:4-hydroxybenzoyl-CoA thioesterase
VIIFERPIKFEEVDAANIVFFGRYLTYAHEAMEHFFESLEGGYAGLIVERRIGFPAVSVEMKFTSPLRYGDRLRIETTVAKVGNRSLGFHYRMVNAKTSALSADVTHTVVTTDLRSLTSCEMPDDVRALLLQHREPAAP